MWVGVSGCAWVWVHVGGWVWVSGCGWVSRLWMSAIVPSSGHPRQGYAGCLCHTLKKAGFHFQLRAVRVVQGWLAGSRGQGKLWFLVKMCAGS